MEKLGYCGVDGSKYSVYIATIQKKIEKQQQLAQEYSVPICQFLTNDIICLGCHLDVVGEMMCGLWLRRKCGKDITTCGECGDFSCLLTEQYVVSDSKQRKYLETVNKNSVITN